MAVFVGTFQFHEAAVDRQTLGAYATHVVGQVVSTDDHVLRWRDERTAVGRAQHVVGREHQNASLGLRFGRQRQVNSHLVAVKVSVKGGANQRVNLDCLALNQYRLKRLDTKTVQSWRTVQ